MLCLSHSPERAVLAAASEEETERLGEMIGEVGYPGLTILLCGGLGAGKTLLTKGIGRALGCSRIKSPTFIIVSEHDTALPLIHADLYRLDSHAEVDMLDFENYLDNGCLLVVEWAERWQRPPLDDVLEITIEGDDSDENRRLFEVRAVGERAKRLLEQVLNKIPFK